MSDPSLATRTPETGSRDPRRGLASHVPAPTDVTIIQTEAALVRLLPEWWGLWERAEQATPFQSPAWLWPWWRSFHPGDLFTVAVRRHGELVGLAPLYREVGQGGRRLLPIGISLSDSLDVLVDARHRDEVGSALVGALAGTRDAWDSCCFEELPAHAEALRLPTDPALTDEVSDQSACPVLDLSAWPARPRRRIAKAWKRAERLGRARILRADEKEVPGFLEALIALHRDRWDSRGEPGVLADTAVQEFHRVAAPRLHAAGVLRLYGLEIAGDLRGVYYGFVHRGRACGYLSGFDPDFAFESPGALLLDHAIGEARREGCVAFDFLRGQEGYKYDWGASDRWTRRRVIRPANR